MSISGQALRLCSVVCAASLAWSQAPPKPSIDASSQPAVDQLTAVAHTIKRCPREVHWETHWGKKLDEIERWSVGPPENVVWDVVSSGSVRAPYSGYIQFTVRRQIEVLPDGSMDRYMRKNREYWLLIQRNFVQNPVDYRYEFDVGKNGLELIKSLSRAQCETVGSVASPCQKPDWQSVPSRAYCWGKAAEDGQTVSH
jgi:hypothetical protein